MRQDWSEWYEREEPEDQPRFLRGLLVASLISAAFWGFAGWVIFGPWWRHFRF